MRDRLEIHLTRQREWSFRTFGPPRGIAGSVAHLRKEIAEIEANPGDILEYADAATLIFDVGFRVGGGVIEPATLAAAVATALARNSASSFPRLHTYADFLAELRRVRPLHPVTDFGADLGAGQNFGPHLRSVALAAVLIFRAAGAAGFSPEQLLLAIEGKQRINENRRWPDWRTAKPGAPIEHLRDDAPPPPINAWDAEPGHTAHCDAQPGCDSAADCGGL
ncbi:dATP/dGTP pyrophosphohydrolase domain-containing protein [Rhodopseudomonas palustris]